MYRCASLLLVRLLLVRLFLVLFAVSVGLQQAGAAAVIDDRCPQAADYVSPDAPLTYFASAIRSGHPVNILALGSASSAMTGEGGFLGQMMQALQAARPATVFRLTVLAHRGTTAADMLADMKRALEERHYAVVLWQTGTVEAVQDARVDWFADALQEGVQLVTARDGDVVLIDQQFSRFLRSNTDLMPYTAAMEAVAALPGVALFHRFDLMHSWVHVHAIDLERAPAGHEGVVFALLQHCLGQSLAKFLLNGVGQPPG